MSLRTFLQLLAIFLLGVLSSVLLLVFHLPSWLEEVLGWIIATLTIAAMWVQRARSQSASTEGS